MVGPNGVVGDVAGVAVRTMVEAIGACGEVCGEVAGVVVPSMMVVAIGVCGDACSDVAGVVLLSMTAVVGMSGGDAVAVKISVGAPAAGAVLFAFGAVGMAIARLQTAGNIEMISLRIVWARG